MPLRFLLALLPAYNRHNMLFLKSALPFYGERSIVISAMASLTTTASSSSAAAEAEAEA
eukprot:c16945_g2_i1 orf=66-242(+)